MTVFCFRPHFYLSLGLVFAVLTVYIYHPIAHAQVDNREADHQALIALRNQFTEALNNRDFDAMRPLVIDSLTFISISNRRIQGIDELKAYWDELFEGDQALIRSITVDPKPDGLTEFLSPDVGICWGTSRDTFDFRAVGKRSLTDRWTAIVVRENEQWKVHSVHMSANVLDNPVLDAAKGAGGMIKLLLGLAVGLVAGALIFRRKPKQAD